MRGDRKGSGLTHKRRLVLLVGGSICVLCCLYILGVEMVMTRDLDDSPSNQLTDQVGGGEGMVSSQKPKTLDNKQLSKVDTKEELYFLGAREEQHPPPAPLALEMLKPNRIQRNICGSDCEGCPSSKEWHYPRYNVCSSDPRVIEALKVFYAPYLMDLPGFADMEDRELWLKEKDFVQNRLLKEHYQCDQPGSYAAEFCKDGPPLVDATHGTSFVISQPQYIHAEYIVLRNAVWANSFAQAWSPGCCYRLAADYNVLYKHPWNQVPDGRRFKKLFLLYTAESWTFQHMHEMMAILTNAWDRLMADPEIKVATQPGTEHVLKRFGLPDDRIVGSSGWGVVGAEELHYYCSTPGTHPYILQKQQKLMGIDQTVSRESRTKLFYFSRGASRRCILNESEVLSRLREWLDTWNKAQRAKKQNQNQKQKQKQIEEKKGNLEMDEVASLEEDQSQQHKDVVLEVVNSFSGSIQSRIDQFNFHARALIGPHGGLLYSLFYVPSDTLVVELHPYKPQPAAHDTSVTEWIGWNPHLFYLYSRHLGQRYYSIPVQTQESNRCMRMSNKTIAKLITILEREL